MNPQPFLEAKLGVTDTCGIHNLHGMPGVLGAVVGILSAAMAQEQDYSQAGLEAIWPNRDTRSARGQAVFQVMSPSLPRPCVVHCEVLLSWQTDLVEALWCNMNLFRMIDLLRYGDDTV